MFRSDASHRALLALARGCSSNTLDKEYSFLTLAPIYHDSWGFCATGSACVCAICGQQDGSNFNLAAWWGESIGQDKEELTGLRGFDISAFDLFLAVVGSDCRPTERPERVGPGFNFDQYRRAPEP